MKLRSFVRLYYPAILVLLTFLAFTVYAYVQAFSYYKLRRSKVFEQRTARVAEVLRNRMLDYAQVLRGCQALFNASSDVTFRDWNSYVSGLNVAEHYPGIQGLAVSRYIKIQDTSEFTDFAKTVHKDFKLSSKNEQPVMAPVLYIEPLDMRNKRALGFDLYSEVHRREAIKRAIATGEPSITRKIRLKQETESNVQPGFLMFLPVYSDQEHTKVAGFVSNVFRTHDLMSKLLTSYPELDIEIYDGEKTTSEHLIFTRKAEKTIRRSGTSTDLKSEVTLMIAGLPWRLVIQPNANFGSVVEKQQPFLILAIGLTLSFLLFLITVDIVRRRISATEELARTQMLDKKKDEFISIASHELKTPLTSIKATVQILERVEMKERERFMLNKARSNIEKLQQLIADLLDVSKIQTGQLQLNITQFLLSDLINEAVESVKNIYTTHAIIVSDVPKIILSGDKYRLEQALNNLLINGIKYSPEANEIIVTTDVTKDIVRINVADKGIGISKANQKRIFDRFYRADELSPVISGLGIGLHIANEIINRHNGSIEVNSEMNQGSVFTIVLPVKSENLV